MNGKKPAASAAENPRGGCTNSASHDDAARKDHRQPAGHREDSRDVAAIESTLGQPAGDERRKGIGHQISAGRPEQPAEALRQHRRSCKHREAQQFRARGKESDSASQAAHPGLRRRSSTTIG